MLYYLLFIIYSFSLSSYWFKIDDQKWTFSNKEHNIRIVVDVSYEIGNEVNITLRFKNYNNEQIIIRSKLLVYFKIKEEETKINIIELKEKILYIESCDNKWQFEKIPHSVIVKCFQFIEFDVTYINRK